MKSEQVNELAAALIKAQSELKPAHKSGSNTFYKKPDGSFHTYATLEDVWNAARDVLTKNGLCIVQRFEGDSLLTTLLHASGQFIEGSCPLINQKGDMQGMMSALTYARRYSLSSICGLADEDDDANTADQVSKKNETLDKCSDQQAKMIYARLASKGYVGPDVNKWILDNFKYVSNREVPYVKVNEVLDAIERLSPKAVSKVHKDYDEPETSHGYKR